MFLHKGSPRGLLSPLGQSGALQTMMKQQKKYSESRRVGPLPAEPPTLGCLCSGLPLGLAFAKEVEFLSPLCHHIILRWK